ncbi:MAG: deoxyribodipyrimidine photo-lyase [Syntrophales bacterium]|nr:deoxyribodipyrimidine photo-lyase [Syntrophales bacterium]
MIQRERIRELNDAPVRSGAYILYWMQAAQRAHGNHALEYAIRRANEAGLPVVCTFVLTEAYPEGNLRHYRFLVEGLVETAARIKERGVLFVLRYGNPPEEVLKVAREASLLVVDGGYVRIQRLWRDEGARSAPGGGGGDGGRGARCGGVREGGL